MVYILEYIGKSPGNDQHGDYENAVTIFGQYFDIIKTNGFKVSDSGHDIIDNNGNKIIFNKNDIVFQNNYGLTSSDFNADGSVKAGTVITSIPIKNINVEDAFNCASTNRNTTKLKMQEKMSKIKGESWLTQQVVSEDNFLDLSLVTLSVPLPLPLVSTFTIESS